MKNLKLSSLILLLLCLASCSPSILKGFHKTETTTISKESFYPFFQEENNTLHFNMQIDFRKNHFSGLLIIKPMGNSTYRAVLNSYFGMSIFDLEFSPDTFIVHQCMEALNKKQVIRTLKNDFSNLFFFNTPETNQAQVYQADTTSNLNVYKVKINKNKQYYLVNNKNKELLKLEIPHFFSSLQYEFTNYNQQFPSTIHIKHSRIGLKLQLEKLAKQ